MSRCVAAAVGLLAALSAPPGALGEGPADPLLRLAPGDAALTLAVEDLRGHAREVLDSPAARDVRGLPFVRDWLESDRAGGFRRARGRVEAVLGDDLSTVRDRLLGKAFVLTLRVPPGKTLDDARGLLLVRDPDRATLARLIDGLNRALSRSGELARVVEKSHNGTTYHVREFRPGGRVDESYAVIDGAVFAWSNSEEMVRAAIDRRAGAGGGLGDSADFLRVRGKLPERALASLYLDPRFAERVLAASPRPEKPSDERGQAMLTRYLAAVRYAGLALDWQNGPVLHTEESVDPARLPQALTRWAARPEPVDPVLWRVPRSALAVASACVDFGAVLEGLEAVADEPDRVKFETAYLALDGVLLGLDFRSGLAPRLGPGLSAYFEARADAEPGARPPWVFTAAVGKPADSDRPLAAVDNALRTFLALYSLDPRHGGGARRVETTTADGTKVTALASPSPFAYAIRDGRVVVGRDADAVARALAAQADPGAGDRVGRLRSAFFPDASSFAAADLKAVAAFASAHRPAIARRLAARRDRPPADVARDLDRALSLLGLFDAAFVASEVDADFTRVHRRFGLVRTNAGPE